MAPMWIAKEAGFFKKQGLDVKLVFIASGPIGTTSLLAGETDVGIIGGFAPVRAIAGGAKGLVIIGQTKNSMVGAIVGRKEIGTVQGLKGKRVGIDRIGSNPEMYTTAALARFQTEPVWELRIGEYRVFYDVDEQLSLVMVRAIRHKPPHKTMEEIL